MTSGATPIPTRGPLMPILAIGAAALAGIVWIVPLPILKPPPPPPAFVPPPAPPSAGATLPESEPAPEWAALVIGLESLRDKPPEVPIVDVPATEVKPDVKPTEASRPTGLPPLGWSYKGTIDGPGSKAALVTFADGKSRFLFVGQRVADITNPSGKQAVVKQIEHDHILVDRDGTEERVQLSRTELANPLRGRISALGNPR